MSWFFVVIIVLVLGGAFVAATGRGTSMRDVYDDRPDPVVPVDRPLRAADLDDISFTTAIRGYRMDEVDALLARLRAEWAQADRRPKIEGEPHAE